MKEQKIQIDAKLSGKAKRNKTKKVLLQENEDSSDNEHHSLFSKDLSSDDDIEWAKSPSPPIEEEIHRGPKPEDFVLIKFPIKGTTDHIYFERF